MMAGAVAAVLISAACVLALLRFSGSHRREFVTGLRAVEPAFLAVAGAIMLASWALEAIRLMLLVSALGDRLTLGRAFRITLIGGFMAGVTPFDSGGEPAQVYMLHRSGVGLGESAAAVTVKGLLNAFARLALGLAIPLWLTVTRAGWDWSQGFSLALTTGLAVYVLVLGSLTYLAFNPHHIQSLTSRLEKHRQLRKLASPEALARWASRLGEVVDAFREGVRRFSRERRTVLYAVGIMAVLNWVLILMVPAVLLRGLGVRSPWAHAVNVAIVFYLVSAYAPTPGSAGAAELGFATLFVRLVPLPFLAVFVFLWRFVTYYLTMLLGGAMVATEVWKKWGRGLRLGRPGQLEPRVGPGGGRQSGKPGGTSP